MVHGSGGDAGGGGGGGGCTGVCCPCSSKMTGHHNYLLCLTAQQLPERKAPCDMAH